MKVRRALTGTAAYFALLLGGARNVAGQSPAQPTATAQRVAADEIGPEVVRQANALSADSLRRRDTPSHQLESVARYLADEFRQLGLRPFRANTWIQRYPVPGQRQVSDSGFLKFVVKPKGQGTILDYHGRPVVKEVDLHFNSTFHFTPEVGPQTVIVENFSIFGDIAMMGSGLTLIAGPHTVESVHEAADKAVGRAIVYVPSANADSLLRRKIITELYSTNGRLIVVSDDDATRFADGLHAARKVPGVMMDEFMRYAAGPRQWPWALTVWAGAVRDVLGAAGEDLPFLRITSVPIAQELPTASAIFFPLPVAVTYDSLPNVIGVLEGSDRKNEIVVIAAHMDNYLQDSAFAEDGGADSSFHDNTAGVAGLLAMAKAFMQPGMQPRRSIAFLATSGAKEQWGANYAASGTDGGWGELGSPVLNLSIDRIAQPSGDSVVVDGLRDLELPMSPEWVPTAFPETGLTVADGGTVVRPGEEHFAFVQRTIPSLYFHTERKSVAASPPIDVGHVARIARFVFYVGFAVANADRMPLWTTEGRERLQDVIVP